MPENTPTQSFTSTFGGQLLGNAASQASSGLIGQLFGGWNARRQWKYMKKQMELQQQYQLEQMQKQYEYQRNMFDYSNAYNEPAKVIARYQAAGINPAAVMGTSGASMSATMSPASAPSGGPVSGGSPVSPAPSPTSGNLALEASQVRVNNATATELSTRSDLNQEKSFTEESVRNVLSATVDEKVANSYFLEQKSIYQDIVNQRYGDITDAQILQLLASANNLLASANLSNEQVNLVKAQAAETLMRAELDKQLIDTNSELSRLYRSQNGFIGLTSKDLRNNIDSLKNTQTFTVQMMVKDSNTGKYEMRPATMKLNGYQAKALALQLSAQLGANEAARSFIVSDWEEANQIRGTVQGYTFAGSSLINAVSNAIDSAKPSSGRPSLGREYYGPSGDFIGGYRNY